MAAVRLAVRREVAESLLRIAGHPAAIVCDIAPYETRMWRIIEGARLLAYDDVYRAGHGPGYGEVCIEAAYRLIESSPTLRREWFGTPNRKKS